jgi:hypothetical protein
VVSLSVRACDSVTLGRLYRTRGLGSLSVTRRARPMITYLKQLGIRKCQSGHVRTRVGPRCHNVNRQPDLRTTNTGGARGNMRCNDRTKVQSRTANTTTTTGRTPIKDQGSSGPGRGAALPSVSESRLRGSRLTRPVAGRRDRRGRRPAGAQAADPLHATLRDQIVASSRSRRVGPARGDRASYQQSQRGDRMTAKATSTDPLGRLARKSNATSLV